MKYKILENPNYEETYELIEEGLRKKATILLFACCRVSYEGRATRTIRLIQSIGNLPNQGQEPTLRMKYSFWKAIGEALLKDWKLKLEKSIMQTTT